MTFVIKGEKKKQIELFLRKSDCCVNRYYLSCTGEDGRRWNLLRFEDGCVTLCEDIWESSGLPVDDLGRLVLN